MQRILFILFFFVATLSPRTATRVFSGPTGRAPLVDILNDVLQGRPGAAVVVDVASGKVIASHNMHEAASRLDYPGSTVKPFVLQALLERGLIRPDERVACRRSLTIGRRGMDCTHPLELTSFDAESALAYSCNSYFSRVATRLSPSELQESFRRAGLDSPSRFAAHESTGTIRVAADRVHLQLEALGHDGVVVTPLELLAAYRKLAFRRRAGDLGGFAPVFRGLEDAVQFGMANTAHSQYGTVAGKTGTATGVATPASHGFFLGYAPAERPEIVMVVYLPHGDGMEAAAVARSVFDAYFRNHSRT